LVAQLTAYLAIPAPSSLVRTAAVTICPASYKLLPKLAPSPPLYVPISYLSAEYFTNNPDVQPVERTHFPFGRPDGTPAPEGVSKKVTSIRRPSDSWAMTD